MKISVLMAVYKSDRAEYLDRALKSVYTDQTYKPYEIILVQDGPVGVELESTINQWRNLMETTLVVIKNEENIGLTKSLNIGLKHITGDFIARMDSDDISHPRRFELQHNFLLDNPEIDVVGGSLQEFNDKNECLNIRHYPQNPKLIKKYICKASPLAHPTVMMRRRIFDSGLSYDERFRTSQDIAFWFDVLDMGHNISNISDITIYFRLAEDVFKRRSREKAFNEFKIYMNGIYRLHGLFTLSYIYPISRLIFRLLPQGIIKRIYGSSLRRRVLAK